MDLAFQLEISPPALGKLLLFHSQELQSLLIDSTLELSLARGNIFELLFAGSMRYADSIARAWVTTLEEAGGVLEEDRKAEVSAIVVDYLHRNREERRSLADVARAEGVDDFEFTLRKRRGELLHQFVAELKEAVPPRHSQELVAFLKGLHLKV